MQCREGQLKLLQVTATLYHTQPIAQPFPTNLPVQSRQCKQARKTLGATRNTRLGYPTLAQRHAFTVQLSLLVLLLRPVSGFLMHCIARPSKDTTKATLRCPRVFTMLLNTEIHAHQAPYLQAPLNPDSPLQSVEHALSPDAAASRGNPS
ncbi:hypothetical protein BDV95DRAFT_591184 [Massariosphaeria phaeospora]|uniref:Uncharacterized protein n=1 Tax=Massariosphaeria phaeospora TaxID=100035 RepID=A0A7C8MKN7_9PLEO|nr:hypothetical protein BDV95DRAFT_591184 [Massariosphaeria phaeospora]